MGIEPTPSHNAPRSSENEKMPLWVLFGRVLSEDKELISHSGPGGGGDGWVDPLNVFFFDVAALMSERSLQVCFSPEDVAGVKPDFVYRSDLWISDL